MTTLDPGILPTTDVLGGDARLGDHRIPVWLVVAHRGWGESNAEIIAQYPGFTDADLDAAWSFYVENAGWVDTEPWAHEEAE